jgi:hypothetical protein
MQEDSQVREYSYFLFEIQLEKNLDNTWKVGKQEDTIIQIMIGVLYGNLDV